ncbi:RNA methyltransferase tRNA(m5U54)methyltransferase, partial [Coemansia sp. 'formosensis']
QCQSKLEVGGPCWLGPLHNKDFVERMYNSVSSADSSMYGTQPRMKGMLKVILEELNDVPFHYSHSELCSAVRASCPPLVKVNSALLNAGYRVSGSHTQQGSIKTDAPPQVVWDVMRTLVKEMGRSPKIVEGSPADKLLAKPITTEISFKQHKDANPESRRIKLVRYQMNPEKNWGPKARHSEAPKAKTADAKRKQQDQSPVPEDSPTVNAPEATANPEDATELDTVSNDVKKLRTE